MYKVYTGLMIFIVGMFVGASLTHIIIWRHLDKVGISRLVEHETIVDGVMTTNWVEIIWKDKRRNDENKGSY